MTRLMLMTFFGERRWKKLQTADGQDYHPHESPAVMTIPMIVLAARLGRRRVPCSAPSASPSGSRRRSGELTEAGGAVPCRTR